MEILIKKYDDSGDLISTEAIDRPKNSIYSNSVFMEKIQPKKLKAIKASENDDIEYWWDMVKITKYIDLNSLPVWFTDGLSAMVSDGILTNNQVDTFLDKN